jgi:hypothetical protein
MAQDKSQPPRILFVSEIDADLGFDSPLIAIANAIKDKRSDCEILFFIRDPINSGQDLLTHGFTFLPAPTQANPHALISNNHCYADVLLETGFSRCLDLQKSLTAWDAAFEYVNPHLVIVSNSPTAAVAARGRYEFVTIGNGFTLPPVAMQTFPSASPSHSALAGQSFLLSAINEVLRKRSVPPLRSITEVLQGKKQFLITIDLLDPHHLLRRTSRYYSIHGTRGLLPPVLSPNMFLTMPSNHPGLSICARAAERCGVLFEGFAFGGRTVFMETASRNGGTMSNVRPVLTEALSKCRFVVTCDIDVVEAAIIAGRPIVVIPGSFQESRAAKTLFEKQIAVEIKAFDENELTMAFQQMLFDDNFTRSSQEIARRIAQALPAEQAQQTIADQCLSLLNQ